MKRLLTLGVWMTCLTGWIHAQATIELHSAKGTDPAGISVRGPDVALQQLTQLPAAKLAEHFQVFVKAALDRDESTPVMGSLMLKNEALVFEPRFPLQPGVEYVVRYRKSADEAWRTQTLSVPKKNVTPTVIVTQVYPTASTLPQNLLKFYIHFSAPMSQGESYQHIELQGPDGKPLQFPFLEIAEELWDRPGQRLTLLLDPARVKRGLVPREEDGPILVAGSRYRLVVKPTWPDAEGVPLQKGFSKVFTVGPEDFRQPDPGTWQIKSPKSKTRDPVTFIMPEPMDHATFARGVTVENSRGEVVLGEFTFSREETQAHFTPIKNWRPGLYDVRILKRIEDLAGNSIARPFELDRFEKVATPANERVSWTIEIQ